LRWLSWFVVIGLPVGLAACAPTLDVSAGPAPVSAAPPTLQRLTSSRYLMTVQTLLAVDGFAALRLPKDLERDTLLHGFSTVGASELTISPRAAEIYEGAALDLSAQVFSDPARRKAWVGCEPQESAPSDDCVQSFVERLGRRVYRRPLTREERTDYVALAAKLGQELGDPWQGLRYVVVAFLQSPHFLYLIEQAEPDPERPDRLRYTGFELASRMSYFLWNSSPDEELLAAAERGELFSDEGLRRQVQRMQLSALAQAALDQFFSEYLYLDRLETVSKDAKLYPEWTPQLAQLLRAEILQLMRDLAQSPERDLRELFDSPTTFVNDELASFYGLPPGQAPPPGQWRKIELPATAVPGLLGRAGLLAMGAHATVTSPTLRGKFIRQQLLCQDISPPPPGVVTTLPVDERTGPQTMRERLTRHRTEPACAGCHRVMDPIGLSLEHFGPTGKFRTKDNGLEIDASGDLDGQAFADARELTVLLRQSPRIATCLTRQVYRHATAHLELPSELDQIVLLGQQFAQRGFRYAALVEALVLSEGFRYAVPPELPSE